MIKHKANGDIYFGKIRIYNGYRQAPVRWAEFLLCAVLVPIVYILLVMVMGI